MIQSPFHTILSHFRKFALSERDKGDKFERLMQAYLQNDPRYAAQFKMFGSGMIFPPAVTLAERTRA